MGKWEEVELSSVCSKITDGSHNPPKKQKAGFLMISARNIVDGELDLTKPARFISKEGFQKENRRTKITEGDILLSIVGSIGLCTIVPKLKQPLTAQRSLAVIQTNLYSKFLKYFFDSPYFQSYCLDNAKGTAQKGIYLKTLRSIKIPLAPLPEQQRIVAVLDGLFEKIDAAIVLLEENIAHTKALMGSVLDEEFGNGKVQLKEVCEIGPKKSQVRDLLKKEIEVSFLPMRDLNENKLTFKPNETKSISAVYKGYTYFEDDDVLLAKVTPCFQNGKAGIAKNLQNGIGFGSSEYHILRASDKVLPEWIYFALSTDFFKATGKKNMTGTGGLKRVPKSLVEEWEIPLPNIQDQQAIINKLINVQKNIEKTNNQQTQQLEHLRSLKASLLDRAFRGEL